MSISIWIIGGIVICSLVFLANKRSQSAVNKPSHRSHSKPSQSRGWIPQNRLEEQLEKFGSKDLSRSAFLGSLVASEIVLLTNTSGDVSPDCCAFRAGAGGAPCYCVYTSLSQAKLGLRTISKGYEFMDSVKSRLWIPTIPNGSGIVINPLHHSSLELLPDDIRQLKIELS